MAEQTLLEMVQGVSRLLGLEVPAAVVAATTNATVMQLLEIANMEVQEHSNREFMFPKLKVDTTFNFTTDANHIAVNLSTAAAFLGMRAIVPETLWDTTQRIQLAGPLSDRKWGELLTFAGSPTTGAYRVVGNNLLIWPNNSVQHVYVCSYMSKFGVLATNGTTRKETFTVDTDTPMLPSRIVKAGIIWRWRQTKGQAYSEEKDQYELFLGEEAHQESIPTPVSMDQCGYQVGPKLYIPAGSW